MILNISKVRSVAAGYICTCSELITKLQRTSYSKALWEDTIIVKHYYWRLWQDPKRLICYCKLTITAENEDSLARESRLTAGRLTQGPPGEAAPEVTQVSLHTLGTQAPPPCQGVQHCPRAPLSSSCSRAEMLHRAGPAHSPQHKRLLHTIIESAWFGI